jgi:Domain of unknown function (DUF4260)
MSTTTATRSETATIPSVPGVLLRIEGLTVLLGAIALYAHQQGSWLAFVVLLFVPDLSMVGYLVSPRLGSMTYNAVHFYTLPALLLAASVAAAFPAGIHLALIWLAHIGMDRTCAFGLKYWTAFKDTHMQRV